jgi:hypothetical protein
LISHLNLYEFLFNIPAASCGNALATAAADAFGFEEIKALILFCSTVFDALIGTAANC